MPEIDVGSIRAADHARLHYKNLNDPSNKHARHGRAPADTLSESYEYPLQSRRSDDTLREAQRNDTLLRADAEGQTPRVEYLIRLGADVDYADQYSLTALHFAAYGGFDDTVRSLIVLGADVNAESSQCGTALCLAVFSGRKGTIDILLTARADVRATSMKFGTAVHIACLVDDAETLKSLLISGAFQNVVSMAKFEVMIQARGCNLLELAALEMAAAVTCSPLHIAAQLGYLQLVQMLVNYGADINVVDRDGYSPTVYALRGRHFDVAQALLSSGAIPTRTRLLKCQLAEKDSSASESEIPQSGPSHGGACGVLLHSANLGDLPHVFWRYHSPDTYERSDSRRARERGPLSSENLRAGMKQALKDGIEYLWEETWCMSESDSEEDILESTYLSHVRQQQAERCYVYLNDVKDGEDVRGCKNSSWFFRPRTVANLFAPKRLEFFARNWNSIGTRESLDLPITSIRKLEEAYLDLLSGNASVATKLSWFAGTLEETMGCFAYAVMWMFGTVIQIHYDPFVEVEKSSWTRLQAAIFRKTDNYSIFAWRGGEGDDSSTALFADNPRRFAGCGDIMANGNRPQEAPVSIDSTRLVAKFIVRQDRTKSLGFAYSFDGFLSSARSAA
ncbi:hypothetical protein LTR95_009291 [Oleoguttula sp. CCFEE 5521]